MTNKPDTVAEVRARANQLRSNLPQSVDVFALGVKSKTPFQLLCTREALIWRTEELVRTVCDALNRDDFTVAAILTRAVTENAAITWKLMDILIDREKYSPQQMNDLLMRLLLGSKIWGEAPNPVHVLDCLRKMDKKIPGVLSTYDSLSEIVHPNWGGVAGLYSKNDTAKFITYFGRGLRGADEIKRMIVSAVLGSLNAFEYAYNYISDILPSFLGELENIWSE